MYGLNVIGKSVQIISNTADFPADHTSRNKITVGGNELLYFTLYKCEKN